MKRERERERETLEKVKLSLYLHAVLIFSLDLFIFPQLGGKNAGIVFKDADLDKCLPTMIRSSFINQGEVCLTTSRIYVRQEIYQNFLDRFVKMTK